MWPGSACRVFTVGGYTYLVIKGDGLEMVSKETLPSSAWKGHNPLFTRGREVRKNELRLKGDPAPKDGVRDES